MTTTVSACPFCHKEVGNEQCAMCADTPTHSPTETVKTILEYAKENKIKNRRWCKKCGLTEGDIDNGCKHDWKLHLLEDSTHPPTEPTGEHAACHMPNCVLSKVKHSHSHPNCSYNTETTVEKWEDLLSQTLLDYETQMVKDFKNTANWRTDWSALYFSLSELLSHLVQEAKAGERERIQQEYLSALNPDLLASLKQEDV